MDSAEEIVRGYYAALAAGPDKVDWDRWFAPDVIQEEFPNRLLASGARRDLAGMRAAAERGRALLSHQEFRILEVVASGQRVVVEAEWLGVVAHDAGPFKAGTELRTRYAQVIELRDGKIVGVRNYDCFYPW